MIWMSDEKLLKMMQNDVGTTIVSTYVVCDVVPLHSTTYKTSVEIASLF